MEEEIRQPEGVQEEISPEQSGENMVLQKPAGKRKWIPWAVFLLVLLTLIGIYVLLFQVNRFSLDLVLEGDQEMLVEYGSRYQEPGVDILLRGTLFWKNGVRPADIAVEISGNVQENVPGKYTVNYTVSYYKWTAQACRSVRVVDTICPVITLIKTDNTILPGQHYKEEGFIAVDNLDGNLTDKVRRTEELGKIIYTVMDSSGNPAYAEREIPYYDPVPPEIILEGGTDITIPCGTIYTEPGFTATDNADGDITERVGVEGEVIWYQPGMYEVAYTVSDVYGNVTQLIRKVQVEAKPWPDTEYPNGKVIYLTFDDGPGPHTGRLLDLLDYYGVKATFFVTNSGYDGTMWRIVNEGHSIGIHTMTHNYNTIYASPENYFRDLWGMQDIIYRNTGVKTTLLRFPGGGSNLVSKYNEGIMTTLAEAVQNAGFQYFDWNVDSNDAGGALRAKTVAANVIGGVQNQRVSIVLQHDIHDFSVEAVEDIIVWGLDNGYRFLPLKDTSPTMHHTVLN